MKEILEFIIKFLPDILLGEKGFEEDLEINTMYINYEKPYVSRIWFKYKDYRVYLHKIEPCDSDREAFWHPHPWESAVKLLKGHYEMGIGYGEGIIRPKTASTLWIGPDTIYEMIEKDAWHYVAPFDDKPVISIMVTGKLTGREMPLKPTEPARKLTTEEVSDMLIEFGFNTHDIAEILKKIK